FDHRLFASKHHVPSSVNSLSPHLDPNGVEHVGTYDEAASVQLKLSRIVELQGRGQTHFVEYIPLGLPRATTFEYSRHAFVGVVDAEVLIAQNMAPWMRICLPGRRAWSQRFQPSGAERPIAGPPFIFYETDWMYPEGIHAEKDFDGLTFSPDLPGQVNTGHGLTQECLGWHADWVAALLERQDLDLPRPLGAMTRLFFNDTTHATWAVEVYLQGSVGRRVKAE
ncbi:hypothetical protein C8R46DRAFT_1102161, partial [Mycena filopes]